VAWVVLACRKDPRRLSLGDPGRLVAAQVQLLSKSNGDYVSFKIKKYVDRSLQLMTLFQISQWSWKLGQLPTS
jgi:hypothetical protein